RTRLPADRKTPATPGRRASPVPGGRTPAARDGRTSATSNGRTLLAPDSQMPATPGGRASAVPGSRTPVTPDGRVLGVLGVLPSDVARPATAVAGLLATARETAAAGGTAEDVLWAVGDASGLAGAWLAASLHGGPAGAAADRDLDAMVALFDAAARFCDRLPGEGPLGFLDHLAGQQIPGDTLAAQAPPGDAVRVLTA